MSSLSFDQAGPFYRESVKYRDRKKILLQKVKNLQSQSDSSNTVSASEGKGSKELLVEIDALTAKEEELFKQARHLRCAGESKFAQALRLGMDSDPTPERKKELEISIANSVKKLKECEGYLTLGQ